MLRRDRRQERHRRPSQRLTLSLPAAASVPRAGSAPPEAASAQLVVAAAGFDAFPAATTAAATLTRGSAHDQPKVALRAMLASSAVDR